MDDLLSGGAVGAGLQEALKALLDFIVKGRDFKPSLENNVETLHSLTPLVEEIKKFSNELDRPKEIEKLENEVKAGRELVNKCSKFSLWRFRSLPLYHDKLQKRGKKLVRYLTVDVQTQIARDAKETLCKVREILEILMKECDNNVGMGNHERGNQLLIRGLSGPPEKPEFTVGLDQPFNKLKIELLKDGGFSIHLLTGLGGSGKTTLAKMLCWDDQVKGIGWHRVPEFQSDEDAINRLGNLLKQIAIWRSPILLVLDDVRAGSGSEALVEKFKFQISNYKILVTTRVAFPRFGNPYHMKPLNDVDAFSLFCRFTQLKFPGSDPPDEDLVKEIVRGCKGLPLALEVIGGLLCKQHSEKWQVMKKDLESKSILKYNNDLVLARLQSCLDILEDESSIKEKECFMDLGLFPENERIRVLALIDMWAELYELDEDGKKAMTINHNLTNKNLVSVIDTRKMAVDKDLYYNNHFLTQHDLFRELAIHQSSQESVEQRKRLIIDLSGNNRPEWWEGRNQKGIFSQLLSLRWIHQKQKQVAARTLSITTDDTFTSDWCDMQPDEVEVLVLNIRSSKYTLPTFIDKMSQLKVLIVTNYGSDPSELENFELLGCLPNLKRIMLEKVSIPPLCKLKSLQKLSIYMCNTRHAFGSSSMKISDALPNLVELNIDYCNDMVELPSDICKITTLKRLSITNCHKLSALPQDTGKLENLEVLRLSSCSDLVELSKSVVRLHKLRFLDISNCLKLTQLPRDFGDLLSLEKLYIWGCSSLNEPQPSVENFQKLKFVVNVVCDEEIAALWENFSSLPNLKIELPKPVFVLNWLPGVCSQD